MMFFVFYFDEYLIYMLIWILIDIGLCVVCLIGKVNFMFGWVWGIDWDFIV